MSKSFYKEALLAVVTEALKQPGKPVIIEHTGLNELKKVIEQAQKQEQLLELYKKLVTVKDDMLGTCEVVDDDYYDMRDMEVYLKRQIKELENDK